MDIAEMQKRVNEISDEVNELHPVLKALFPKLPRITNCEYTHGISEFGADFILTRQDDTLGDSEYIGIIAKTQKINQGNLHSGIDRQINECGVKRLIQSGKKEVILSEIWIVTSQSISQNAKEMINHNYVNKSIKFIPGEKLADLINRYIPQFWLNIDISESDLLGLIKRDNQELDKSLSLINVEDKRFYISQEIIESYNDDYFQKKKKKQKVINIFSEIINCKYLFVEGGMGSGKSKLLRHIVDHFSDYSIYQESNLIPLLINYIDFEDKYNFDFNRLLADFLHKNNHEELKDKQILFLIDGFDEKKNDKENRVDKLRHIYNSVKDVDEWKVVLTSRFLSGLVDEDIDINFCKRLELSPLSLNQTIKFLERLCHEINLSSRIIEDLKKSPLMKELPRSPISVILLAELLNENSKELPSNLTELYSKYLEYMLGRWDLEKGLETQKEYQISERIIQNVALDFINNNMSSIPIDDCLKYFEDYISERSFTFSSKFLFDRVLERSNILRYDNTKNNIIFSHRTFAEYYYAKYKKERASLEINDNVFNIYWMNIYFFYVGLHEDCPGLLDEISNYEPESEPERWLKIINLSNFFLAGFSSPYKSIEDNLYKPIFDAAKLYLSIIKGEIKKSPFSFLSEITFLWWVQFILRESYAYDFFRDALETIVLKIEDETDNEEIKMYSHFFAALIFNELGESDALEYFLNKYRNQLPTNLKLGIFYEGNKLKKASKHFKKQLKSIRQALSEMPKQRLELLHNRPISKAIDNKH
jgi:hypothetical protein